MAAVGNEQSRGHSSASLRQRHGEHSRWQAVQFSFTARLYTTLVEPAVLLVTVKGRVAGAACRRSYAASHHRAQPPHVLPHLCRAAAEGDAPSLHVAAGTASKARGHVLWTRRSSGRGPCRRHPQHIAFAAALRGAIAVGAATRCDPPDAVCILQLFQAVGHPQRRHGRRRRRHRRRRWSSISCCRCCCCRRQCCCRLLRRGIRCLLPPAAVHDASHAL